MAEDVSGAGEGGEQRPGTAVEPVTEPAGTEVIVAESKQELVPYQEPVNASTLQPHVGRRFSWAYAVIAAVFVIGALGTVMALTGFRPGAPPRWSDFRPAGERLDRAQDIAEFVAPRYRLDDGNQMVAIRARDTGVGAQPIQFLAVLQEQGYDVIQGPDTIAYEMCGLGERCAIRTGTPSTDRDRLLRREALEVALYTFKYVSGTDAVVVFMPPPPGEAPTWALLFRKGDYEAQLDEPIGQTLTEPAPNPSSLAASAERDLVEQLTGASRYSYKVEDVNGAPVLVLEPPQA